MTTEVPPNKIDVLPKADDINQSIELLIESLKRNIGVDNYEIFKNTFAFNKNTRTTSECQEALLSELRRLYSNKTDKSKHYLINNVWLVVRQLNMMLNEANVEIDKTSLCMCILGVALGNID